MPTINRSKQNTAKDRAMLVEQHDAEQQLITSGAK